MTVGAGGGGGMLVRDGDAVWLCMREVVVAGSKR